LGDLYLIGQGVQQDDRVGATWLQKAAEKGDTTAQTELGGLYLTGRGVPRDDAVAAGWLTKAADQGDRDAQAKLAALYEYGRGVPRDLNRAYILHLLSLEGKRLGAES
jgi:TPR repeat protein